MDHYANKAKQSGDVGEPSPSLHVPDLQLHSPAPTGCASSLSIDLEESGNRDEPDWFRTDEFNQFSTQENESVFPESFEGARALYSSDQEPHASEQRTESRCMNSLPSSSTPQVADKTTKKTENHQHYINRRFS